MNDTKESEGQLGGFACHRWGRSRRSSPPAAVCTRSSVQHVRPPTSPGTCHVQWLLVLCLLWLLIFPSFLPPTDFPLGPAVDRAPWGPPRRPGSFMLRWRCPPGSFRGSGWVPKAARSSASAVGSNSERLPALASSFRKEKKTSWGKSSFWANLFCCSSISSFLLSKQ